jgi:glycogen operon protein
MTDEDWGNPFARCLGLRLAGDAIDEVDERGNCIIDDTLLMLLNAHHEPIPFVIPAHRARVRWELLLDTQDPTGIRQQRPLRGGETYALEARSLALLRVPHEESEAEQAERTMRGRRRRPMRRSQSA